MVTFSMTLTYPLPGFQGHGIFEVEYLKNSASWGQSYYRTLIGNHTVPLSMTLIGSWLGYQGNDIFDIEYLRNDTR